MPLRSLVLTQHQARDRYIAPVRPRVGTRVCGREPRELQARAGRRTGELCALRHDCLGYDEILDEAGQLRAAPVLIHDMPKVAIKRYRLPIDEETAEIIREQQARVRA